MERGGDLHPRLPMVISRTERLKGVAACRAFQDFSGLTEGQLLTPRRERKAIISAALSQLNEGEDKVAIADALFQFNRAEEI